MSGTGFHPQNTSQPIGPLRSKAFHDDVDTNDFELTDDECFVVQVTGAGDSNTRTARAMRTPKRA